MVNDKEELYLFGAGLNGKNIISFIGKKNIIAIVDNSEYVIGEKISGIDVISFDDFLKHYRGEEVLITSMYFANDIEQQLLDAGITNIYKSPFMTSKMIDVDKWIKELINKYAISDILRIFIYPLNPLTRCIANNLKTQKYRGEIHFLENEEEIDQWINKNNQESFLMLLEGKENVYGKNIIHLMNESYDESDFEDLKKYKDIHKGKKCFVIGNGPSLKSTDLDILQEKGITCFGSNGIYKIFAQTSWRPTYYFYGDTDAFSNNGCIQNDQRYFMSDFFKRFHLRNSNIEYFHHILKLSEEGYPFFSEDIVSGVSGGRTITFSILQFAVYMGFKEIYLLGVDFSWGEHGEATHFCDGYVDPKYEIKIRENIMHKDELIKTYISAKKYAEKCEIKIYNATRGGNLEVFERVDFDALFG